MKIKLYTRYKGQLVLNSAFQPEDYSNHCNIKWFATRLKKQGYEFVVDLSTNYNTYSFCKKEYVVKLNKPSKDVYFAEKNPRTISNYSLRYELGCRQCNCCDQWYPAKLYDYVSEDDQHYCSETCLEEDCYTCEGCGCYVSASGSYTGTDDEQYCYSCWCDSYCYCDDCGCVIDRDYAHWIDGCSYCDDCASDRSNKTRRGDYHSTREEGFVKRYATNETHNWDTYLSGLELETVCNNYYNDVIQKVAEVVNADEKLAGFEYDSSVCGGQDGFEMVTQPCSMERWYEDFPLWKKTLQTMEDNTCRSHNTSTSCGLHIHFNRDYIHDDPDTIARIVLLFEVLKDPLIRFSRRTQDQLGEWCRFHNDKQIENIKEFCDYADKDDEHEDRYYAVNITNEETIEIRLFRGTLKVESFYSCLELVKNIVDFAKDKTDEEVATTTFDDIVNYKETRFLRDYCLNRQLI